MFYMQAIRLFSPLLTLLIATGITLGGVKPVAAEQVYIGLRNGPSEAFPVIYEVTPYRRLEWSLVVVAGLTRLMGGTVAGCMS